MTDTTPETAQHAADDDGPEIVQLPFTREEVEARIPIAQGELDKLMLELRARGKNIPMGQFKQEVLIDFLLPRGSDERLYFDLQVVETALSVAESMVTQARQDALRP